MKWLRWLVRRPRLGTEFPLGACGWCRDPLQRCESCNGAWRGTGCDCGLGLRCDRHGRFWS